MNQTERVLREGRRADCYRLFSTCFYPPERDQLLQHRICIELAETLNELYPDTAAAAHAMVLHEQLTQLSETDVRVDHAALFVGPFRLKAAPYGSIYLERNNLLMGDTTLAASVCYAEAGLELTLHEPADHIAVELEFMHYLAALSAQAAHRGDDEQTARLTGQGDRFLNDHLGAWAPAFCAAIKRGANTVFYRALADCLEAFVDAELRHTRGVGCDTVLSEPRQRH
ncbi:MAG: molecular chaperone TorD family protein [Candidatus Rokubacteria bacterium]|nr:molecular chaperone TorD family protein [Candidatus Rokubacteria bacterium]